MTDGTFSEKDPSSTATATQRVVLREIWRIYEQTVLPVERRSFYAHFRVPPISAEEFEARPQVLLLGQYSTGKTSMVRWLTTQHSSHFDVRPQPSTDKFMAVVHGEEERIIHGDAATCLPQLPYKGLTTFGATFLSSFQTLVLPADILQEVTFIDTPGVLSGSKHRIGRDYDFASVAAWLAERADLVFLTFDAHKLDISDEFQEIMEVLRPFSDKVRCILNKADQIDATNLIRVYGALLWNVGKVLHTPEIARVFVSSFWDEAYRYQDHQKLFDEDKEAVLSELRSLPRSALLRKINTFVGRVRRVRAHMCLVAHIRSQLPYFFCAIGAEGQLHRWVEANFERLYVEAQRLRGLSSGDMPPFEDFRQRLQTFDTMSALPHWDSKEIENLERIIDTEVPNLIRKVGGVSISRLSCQPQEFAAPAPTWSWAGRCGKRRRID